MRFCIRAFAGWTFSLTVATSVAATSAFVSMITKVIVVLSQRSGDVFFRNLANVSRYSSDDLNSGRLDCVERADADTAAN